MKLQQILTLFFFFIGIGLNAQTTVRGTVVDGETNEPLIFVNVSIPNTDKGTNTDIEGKFEITTTEPTLLLSYIGYKSLEIDIDLSQKEVTLNQSLYLSPESMICVCVVVTRPKHKIHPAITYLRSEDLQINNEISITPSLNTVPGVFMHSGALNTNRITIRGIGNRNLFGTAKIRAYLDGIPITDGSGESNIEDIDLGIVNAVTVYKGPASSIYGAGLGGMISLQVPEDLYKDGTVFSLENTGGSFGTNRNVFNFARYNEERSLAAISISNTHSDGYRENNSYNRLSFSGYGKLKINEHEEIKFLGNYSFVKARIPSSLDSTDYVDNPEIAAFIWDRAGGFERNKKVFAGATYEASLGKHFSQISSLYTSFRQSYENRPFNILRENSFINGLRTEWIYDHPYLFDFLSDFEVHIGGETFDEDYHWQTYETDGFGSQDEIISDNGEDRNSLNFFAQVKMDIHNNTSITTGVNANYTFYDFDDYFTTDGDQSSYRTFPRIWSPFFNIGLDLSNLVNQEFAVSATVSHGFSPPKVEESFLPDGTINRSILPEQGWNYELGVKGELFNELNYSISLYSMQIRDLLVAQRTAINELVGVNAGRTSHNGLEVTLDYPFYAEEFSFLPYLNYSFADYTFKKFLHNDLNHSGNQLTGTAPHTLSTGIKMNSDNFYGNIIYRFVDEMPLRDDNSIYSDAYQLVNLKAGYKYAFGKDWLLDFSFGVNNLFNEKYASMLLINAGSFGASAPRYYYPGLPRNFYIGLKVGFGK